MKHNITNLLKKVSDVIEIAAFSVANIPAGITAPIVNFVRENRASQTTKVNLFNGNNIYETGFGGAFLSTGIKFWLVNLTATKIPAYFGYVSGAAGIAVTGAVAFATGCVLKADTARFVDNTSHSYYSRAMDNSVMQGGFAALGMLGGSFVAPRLAEMAATAVGCTLSPSAAFGIAIIGSNIGAQVFNAAYKGASSYIGR